MIYRDIVPFKLPRYTGDWHLVGASHHRNMVRVAKAENKADEKLLQTIKQDRSDANVAKLAGAMGDQVEPPKPEPVAAKPAAKTAKAAKPKPAKAAPSVAKRVAAAFSKAGKTPKDD